MNFSESSFGRLSASDSTKEMVPHIFSIHQGLSWDIHKFSKSGGGLEDQCKYRSFQTCLYCLYLFKLYKKLTIILLASSLTNIRSEISKIQLIL